MAEELTDGLRLKAHRGLDRHEFSSHLPDRIEPEDRVSQVVEDAPEDDQVELLSAKCVFKLVNGRVHIFDTAVEKASELLEPEGLWTKDVCRYHATGTEAFGNEGRAAIGRADIEDANPGKVSRQAGVEPLLLDVPGPGASTPSVRRKR